MSVTKKRTLAATFMEACVHYNNGELDQSIEKARWIVQHDDEGGWHRARALTLLASALGDWENTPVGKFARVDTSLESVRMKLENARKSLEAKKPANGLSSETESAVTDGVDVPDVAVEENQASDNHADAQTPPVAEAPPVESCIKIEDSPAPDSHASDDEAARFDIFKDGLEKLKSIGFLPLPLKTILDAINARVVEQEPFTPQEAIGILWQLKEDFPVTIGAA